MPHQRSVRIPLDVGKPVVTVQVRVARADVPGLQVLEPAAGERVRGKRKRVSQKKKTGGGEGEWTAPGWKNAPRERERGDERGCGLAPGSSLSLSVSPTSYCEFTRSRSLVDAIFLSISEITLAVWGSSPSPWIDECCVQDVNRAFWRTDDFATEQGWMLEGGAYQNRHQMMPGPYNLTYN